MLREIEGLRKRTGPIQYVANGPKLDDFGPVRIQDYVCVQTIDGARIKIRVDSIHEEHLSGAVVGLEPVSNPDTSGIRHGDQVSVSTITVHQIIRKND